MGDFHNSLKLGHDHAKNRQQSQIAWQQNGQNQIDARRDAADEFRNFVKRLQGGSHALTSAFQTFKRGKKTARGITEKDFKAVLRVARVPLSDEQIKQLFKLLDDNDSGDISFDEMVKFCQGKQPMTLKLFGDWQKQNGLARAEQKNLAAAKLHEISSSDALTKALKKSFEQQTSSVRCFSLTPACVCWRGLRYGRASLFALCKQFA